VIGKVDGNNRAILPVDVRAKFRNDPTAIEAWVDTAFDGHFVFASKLIEQLGLEMLVETEAILADGTKVTLETYVAYLDWFGELIPVQVVANEGQFPLLGTALLEKCRLTVNFVSKSVELDSVG
jgi:clan AA aspartic protease